MTPDLHVAFLHYNLRPGEQVTYNSPAPVEFETESARIRLADGKLVCEMKQHFETAEEARADVEPVLHAWEADSDLRWSRGEFRLEFANAEIVDRSPAEPGVVRGNAHLLLGLNVIAAAGTVSIHATRGRYPEPPGPFRLTPDAQSILVRYQGYLDGREPLLAMAYFCLTVVEANTGGRSSAAKSYRIEEPVLRKIGELTSRRGDRTSARKASVGAALPLEGSEGAWLEAAIKALVWRLGDTNSIATLPWITLDSLPKL